jgi:hypothetical protein
MFNSLAIMYVNNVGDPVQMAPSIWGMLSMDTGGNRTGIAELASIRVARDLFWWSGFLDDQM